MNDNPPFDHYSELNGIDVYYLSITHISGSIMSSPVWKWVLYNKDGEDANSGECHTLADINTESFWKALWPRHKNPPKWLVDYSSEGVVLAGYKTRNGANGIASDVMKTLVPNIKPQEIRRIRGSVMILRGNHVHTADVGGCSADHPGENIRKSDTEHPGIPEPLRDTQSIPLEYLVRCEGASDDNVNMITLLEREGIMCGPDGEDTPGPLAFATVRNHAREKLWKILGDPGIARDAERGVLEETIREAYRLNLPRVWKNKVVKEIYKTLYAKVWRNLLPPDHPQSVGNPKLVSHVQSGLISATDLAGMSPQKLWPERWRNLEESRILKQIATLERSTTASTNMFTCGRCGGQECTYREVQTRSADEPMTAFILCLVCGNRWKE